VQSGYLNAVDQRTAAALHGHHPVAGGQLQGVCHGTVVVGAALGGADEDCLGVGREYKCALHAVDQAVALL